MFSPPLYSVLKFNLNYIVSHNYNFKLTPEEMEQYKVLQGDDMLFRQIRSFPMIRINSSALLSLLMQQAARTTLMLLII